MIPRFLGRLGLADYVTTANAALGFLAAVAATMDVGIAARLLLLAAIMDALDGIIARKYGSTPAGVYLDSLADVASFGVAPAFLVSYTVLTEWGMQEPFALVGIAIGAVFVGMAVIRLGLYNAYDIGSKETEGVQTTLAATVLAAAVLAGYTAPAFLVPLTAILAVLMVTPITYPDLHPQDAAVMGIVQVLAIVLTGQPGEVFAFSLLFLSLAYLLFAPRFYWQDHLDL
ncbi:protein sorting system archaetidylserine synthase [Halalkaliarchaeum sp. AArc-CO]|uniref:protein sorting system archaetidylserine synthase n=1 Tax=Halalkaliarchaeum sp. AArc-CO TaxID=2866381 RepID=UPI00217E381A|nr:protein sorting system archaetidylserine synthase [Halalkaliarchaeum sp. AArc-CO]